MAKQAIINYNNKLYIIVHNGKKQSVLVDVKTQEIIIIEDQELNNIYAIGFLKGDNIYLDLLELKEKDIEAIKNTL